MRVWAHLIASIFIDSRIPVHVMPLGLVMTRVLILLTATKRPYPYVTIFQVLLGDVRIVQVVPSGLVMTLFPPPVLATATNR